MPDLFLSYSRDDQEVAKRFSENLKREGFDVWWDQALNPGEAFDQVTEEALGAAAAVIVLWSKTSVSSRWVRAEATQANASHRLLPVMIEACTRPIMFELTHTADLSQWKGNRDDPAWQAFVGSTRRFVQRRASGDSTGVAGVTTEPVRPPRPSLGERVAAVGGALRSIASWTGSLLRRYAGRLAFALIGAAIAGFVMWQLRPRTEPEVTRFSIPLPAAAASGAALALSPDGRRLVYRVGNQLMSRRLDQDEATRIPGADNSASLHFFSPDGRSIAFFTADKSGLTLKAFDFSGEATRVLADVKDALGLGGSWDGQGRIFFGRVGNYPLLRVAAVGGVPELFAPLGEYADLDYPDVLPDGRWVLFTANGSQSGGILWSGSDIVAQNVATGERRIVLKGGHAARYLPSGHLVFVRSGTLYAVAFDAEHLTTRGKEVPVVQGVLSDESSGFAAYTVADNGTLAYEPGAVNGQTGAARKVVRISRTGAQTALSAEARNYSSARASPDGSKIAVEVTGEDQRVHIWVMDVKTGAATQLTFDGDEDRFAVWSADNREVVYVSRRGKDHALWRKTADGTGTARHVLDGTDALVATDVYGHTLIFQDRGEGDQRDLFTLDLDSTGPPRPLLATPDDEAGARVSPNGAWIVYVSTPAKGSTPNRRVYVRPFPNTAAGGQRAISEGQGAAPSWSPSGDEILYAVNNGTFPLMAVPVNVTPTTLTPSAPRELFTMGTSVVFTRTGTTLGYGSEYEVLPGGNEFLAVAVANAPPSSTGDGQAASQPHVNVVLNWFEELKRLVPTE